MLGSVATLFAQYVSGYTGRSPEYRGRGTEEKAVWSLPELQDLLDQWIIAEEPPHDGLRDPLHPGRAFTPNEKYAALTETAGAITASVTAPETKTRATTTRPRLIRSHLTVPLCAQCGPSGRRAVTLLANRAIAPETTALSAPGRRLRMRTSP